MTFSKRVVITGASRGIGKAIVKEFLKTNAKIVMMSKDKSRLYEVAEELCSYGTVAKLIPVVVDVTNENSVKKAFKKTLLELGGIDILVNNAGFGVSKHLMRTNTEEWHQTINTNLTGIFYCIKNVVPIMKKQKGGHIINISSFVVKSSVGSSPAYCASKFGLTGLCKAVYNDLAKNNIRITTVYPGRVNTGFTKKRSPQVKELEPGDIAKLVVFVSNFSKSGLLLNVDIIPFEAIE